MKAVFTNFPSDSNWVDGLCGDFTFQAKLFDEPSGYGINEGRVSKLAVIVTEGQDWSKEVISYDRGWDVEPSTDKLKQVLEAILDLCENSAKRFA